MPLNEGAKPGSKGFGENIATEIKANKSEKQAVAIAYSKARSDTDAKLDAIAARADGLGTNAKNSRTGLALGQKNLSPIQQAQAAEKEAKKDALQPNPWANKLAALNGGIDSLTARLARNDAARAFPSYTLSQLKAFLERSDLDADKRAKIAAEVKARESGESKHKVTPQVPWK